ncbi:MAG: DMT family transporter [Candidatus Bathyarchaeia archaeon]
MPRITGEKALGILFGTLAGAMWSIEAIIGKTLLSSLGFMQVAASEAFFASITSLAYMVLSRRPLSSKGLSLRDILVVGVVGSVIAPAAYFLGLSWTLAINATLLAHIQPLFVSILGLIFLNERLCRDDVFGGLMIGLAAILITSRNIENLAALRIGNLGDIIVLLATLGWAAVAIPGKRLAKAADSALIVSYRFLIASAVLLPIMAVSNQLAINSVYQIVLGVVACLGYMFYYEGLKRIKASQVALTELSSPFFTAILAWLILNEHLTIMQVIGAALLIIGLVLLARKER